MNDDLDTIETIQLDEDVTGGAAPRPQLQAPVKQLALPPPRKPFEVPGMAPPKYSAGWWDIVRARGLAL